MSEQTPQYRLSEQAVSLVAHISEAVGRLSVQLDRRALRLRRINRIRTVHGSLAIEGNTLTEQQITAVLEGKPVVAPPREVQEVRNALSTYEQMSEWDPLSEAHLLDAHRVLMRGLLDVPGSYRQNAAGVMGREGVVHVAPPADRVPFQMQSLLAWLSATGAHPLVASSVFHYEFEFIHPFEDGNGRLGRLWQTLILSRWNPVFADLPVESLIYARQADYYEALNLSTDQADCVPSIDFMLAVIHEAIEGAVVPVTETKDGLAERLADGLAESQQKIIRLVLEDHKISKRKMAESLGISSTAVDKNISVLKAKGLLRRVGPDRGGEWEIIG
ncbi:MAG: Fic family protein [Pseudomonadota bacterium]|nr:Fic family protein [Pseudomonadota bacterium]